MPRQRSLTILLAVCLAIFPATLQATDVTTTVGITATVDPFAEWDAANQTIAAADFDARITGVNQTRTATKTFALYMNTNVTITPSAGANSGILTLAGETLTTQYRITGDVTVPDVAYKLAGAAAGQFFEGTNTYAITHVAGDGAYDVTFSVQASSPAAEAPDAGNYTCGVVLTATF